MIHNWPSQQGRVKDNQGLLKHIKRWYFYNERIFFRQKVLVLLYKPKPCKWVRTFMLALSCSKPQWYHLKLEDNMKGHQSVFAPISLRTSQNVVRNTNFAFWRDLILETCLNLDGGNISTGIPQTAFHPCYPLFHSHLHWFAFAFSAQLNLEFLTYYSDIRHHPRR